MSHILESEAAYDIAPTEEGGPAFPTKSSIMVMGEIQNFQSDGMSLRDYFAANALAGGLEQDVRDNMDGHYWHCPHVVADRAYEIAEAMLKSREKVRHV